MSTNFEVGFKLTYEGLITVEASSIKEALEKVKSLMGVSCTCEGEEALEVQSYIHVSNVTEEGDLE